MQQKHKKPKNTCPVKCALSNCSNNKIIIIIILFLVIAMIVIAKNNNQQPVASVINKVANKTENQNQSVKKPADKLEVYYFHRTQRCYSCNTIGRYIKEIIEQKFAKETKNSIIDFREINIDLPENKKMAIKFQASGSSLFINAVRNGQNNISQDINIWRLLNNESQFKNYLENKINSLLGK